MASSVLVQIAEPFNAAYERGLITNLHSLEWNKFLPFTATSPNPKVKVRSTGSRLNNSRVLRGHILNALLAKKKHYLHLSGDDLSVEQQKRGMVIETEDDLPVLHADFDQNMCRISFDISGPLWCRHEHECAVDLVSKKGTTSMEKTEPQTRQRDEGVVLRSDISAACALRTSFLKELTRSAHLTIWDPFCSSSFLLLEILGMVMGKAASSPTFLLAGGRLE